ncbi:MAG: DNA alkylation repair protein [Elusimicrobiales bacterium]
MKPGAAQETVRFLKSHANTANVAGMARYGINPHNTLGVSIPVLRKKAKELGRNHELALALWKTGIHEARILAALVADPLELTDGQAEIWVKGIDSWDICDQACSNLFDKTPFARKKAVQWTLREDEFVRRAGFVLMAALAVHDKQAPDSVFEKFLPHIKKRSADNRNFVKKAANWALRQIGKRNKTLRGKAMALALEIAKMKSPSARWIAADALRELGSRKFNDGARCQNGAQFD